MNKTFFEPIEYEKPLQVFSLEDLENGKYLENCYIVTMPLTVFNERCDLLDRKCLFDLVMGGDATLSNDDDNFMIGYDSWSTIGEVMANDFEDYTDFVCIDLKTMALVTR